MKLTLLKNSVLGALASLALASAAHAVNFDLLTANATLNDGNPGDSSFFHIGGGGDTAGDMSGVFTALLGGDEVNGFWVRVDFNGVQPVLESAFLKAASSYLYWDAADLAAFNAGVYTSITLWNSGPNGIFHLTGGGAVRYHATSHAGINGQPGDDTPGVPDGGMTAILLGLGLAGTGAFRRFVRR